MSNLPEGEQLRKAVKWVTDAHLDNPETRLSKLIEEACLKFDLTPKDEEFLMQFLTEASSEKSE